MKKVFDQTVRDIKREVNKKVLKVPGIEQKVLDATSNEAWGPHGSLLADIALASRNYHEYQIIMAVLWKRINDTGKNWRHVYKGLTVLDYLVANGSERVIDDIREHAYQISTLSSFHYIDSGGRDQGNNVRKKSQSLVDLVNDKERIIEVRQKAATNREKFRSSPGGMHRPSSYGNFDEGYDGRYRDDDRNGRERDYNYRGDRYGDRDRHSTEYDDRYRYKDEDYRGRSRSVGEYSVRSRSSERDNKDEDAQATSRGLERKYSEQNIGAPPSYEDAVGTSPTERNTKIPTSGSSSPAVHTSVAQPPPTETPVVEEIQAFDEFDPRGPASGSVVTATSQPPLVVNSSEMDLLGSLSDSFMAIVPISSASEAVDTSEPAFGVSMGGEDPFGDSPFKAIPVSETNPSSAHQANAEPQASFVDPFLSSSQQANHSLPSGINDFDILAGILPPAVPSQIPPNPSFTPHRSDIPSQSYISQPPSTHVPGVPSQNFMSQPPNTHDFPPQNYTSQPPTLPLSEIPQTFTVQPPSEISQNFIPQPPTAHVSEVSQNFMPQPQTAQMSDIPQSFMSQPISTNAPQYAAQNFMPQPLNTNTPQYPAQNFMPQSHSTNVPEYSAQNYMSQPSRPLTSNANGNSIQLSGQPLAVVPQDKFQTKSTVWSETLSRGLVNLNISGPKTNPLSDIGVDFDSINRKEKRFEKQTAAPVTSNVTMGKAMGTGSGIGRAGASAIRPQQPTVPQNNPYGAQQPMFPQNNPYGAPTRPPYGYPYNSNTPNPYGGH